MEGLNFRREITKLRLDFTLTSSVTKLLQEMTQETNTK